MPEAVDIRQVIGSNVARVRKNRGKSQPAFGRLVAEFLGEPEPWSRQTVSAMENGNRAFTASDLLVLAYVLEVPPTALLYIDPSLEAVQVGNHVFGREDLGAAGWQSDDTTETLHTLTEQLTRVQLRLRDFLDQASELEDEATKLAAAAHRMRLAQSLEASGVDRPADRDLARIVAKEQQA